MLSRENRNLCGTFCSKHLHVVVWLKADPIGKGLLRKQFRAMHARQSPRSFLHTLRVIILVALYLGRCTAPQPGPQALGRMIMRRRALIPVVLASLLAAAGLAAAGLAGSVAVTARESHRQGNGNNGDAPLTLEEIRALVARAIADQHADDNALNEYDRTEHTVSREPGKEVSPVDTVDRVFPTGTGEVRVELGRNGKPVDSAAMEQQWRDIAKAPMVRSNPNDPAIREEYERAERRERAHAEMVDAIGSAFRFRWEGREMIGGRPTIKLAFEPDPSYKSTARFATVFAHTVGTVWFDESSGQVARLEAKLREDVPFYGGLIAKIYRGSWITVAQSEVGPGVWLPLQATYDIEGRKFLFAASWRGQIDASGYRRVGPPAEALALVQREHADAISSVR